MQTSWARIPPEEGVKGLGDFDVVGFNFEGNACYMCEVITHILGMGYKDYPTTVERLTKKLGRQKEYAHHHLNHFKAEFQVWSPVVPSGLAKSIANVGYDKLIINQEYAQRIDQLRQKAVEMTHDTGNPAFRLLQILEHVRETSATIEKNIGNQQ